MAVRSIPVLKSFFITGARPTESNFGDLIDSFVHRQTGLTITGRSYNAETGDVSIVFSDATELIFNVNTDLAPLEAQLAAAEALLDNKVDRESGKGLSSNDFTNEFRTILENFVQVELPESYDIALINGLAELLDTFALQSDLIETDAKANTAITHTNNEALHVSPEDRDLWNSLGGAGVMGGIIEELPNIVNGVLGFCIRTATIPEGVTNIGAVVFNNQMLDAVIFSDTLESIGALGFGNNEIKTITVNEGFRTFQAAAFQSNKISEVFFSSTVEFIGNGSFNNNLITELNFNNGLNFIGVGAFRDNRIQGLVFVPDSTTEVQDNAFLENPNITELSVLTGTVLGTNVVDAGIPITFR